MTEFERWDVGLGVSTYHGLPAAPKASGEDEAKGKGDVLGI